MSDLDKKYFGRFCVGEELTKVTISQELTNAMDFIKRCISSEQSTVVCIDFIKLKRVDTLAVVFIVQIERFIARSSENLKISYQNVPNDLTSLLNLTSIARVILND